MAVDPQLVLFSGGMDSTVLLVHALAQGPVPGALSVDYGQRHGTKELAAARRIAIRHGVPHFVLDLSSWGSLLTGSALTDHGVPLPTGDEDPAATVVPNRNAVMLMAAAGIAETVGASVVLIAAHAGDHAVYPDCRPPFITAASRAAELGTGGKVTVDAPFINLTKADICRLGHDLLAPLHLTWSCYRGGTRHCGTCGACRGRMAAFDESGNWDPTVYAGWK